MRDKLGRFTTGLGRTPWNKNLTKESDSRVKAPSTAFKKGVHYSPTTEFKKGQIPWIKGKHPESLQKENHPQWKGGITPEHNKLRQSPEYAEWRLLVYKRDHYTCQDCGQKHIDIIAHHIKSFVEFEKLRFKVDNGRTLCRACHLRLHKELKTL